MKTIIEIEHGGWEDFPVSGILRNLADRMNEEREERGTFNGEGMPWRATVADSRADRAPEPGAAGHQRIPSESRFIAYCDCGWESDHQPSSLSADARFREHVACSRAEQPPAGDAAGVVEPEAGADLEALLAAYRRTFQPPRSANFIMEMSEAFDAWMEAVTKRLSQGVVRAERPLPSTTP